MKVVILFVALIGYAVQGEDARASGWCCKSDGQPVVEYMFSNFGFELDGKNIKLSLETNLEDVTGDEVALIFHTNEKSVVEASLQSADVSTDVEINDFEVNTNKFSAIFNITDFKDRSNVNLILKVENPTYLEDMKLLGPDVTPPVIPAPATSPSGDENSVKEP
uniref:Uncharacterized protein n=1 Tax=Aureoumbra lagunensis TaxID=44058 RepID=A0A7S3JQ66_9STRA|mmetsp:Transcript_20794/g.26911  ORF Transcript_20794/g.26911 Transcript_20794/m.26911 type:complete len:164 (-) Transcript_20794:202-693(-)|eukprot:CAMPEP_0197320598 /NCGR_PEP_ID=MMETSP0891-20130614/60914_1 /TAXON_ID=44058 ORGANISM="Aureoumbra lagunensis, Strain CCMP1510" /NCGR_SAMPLE_ID=MMETSP0891 /ASSEMBLY_ACC=CAM_ASM_000534 /LENGTH=163 /DNA_ID=CAMNT_0042812083 /DNA_START=23 /DNA_END=514 /DNA_ORIENTATION=-